MIHFEMEPVISVFVQGKTYSHVGAQLDTVPPRELETGAMVQSRQDVSSTKELCGYTELHLDLTEKTNRELFNAVLKAKFMSCTTAEEVFQFDKLSMSAAAGSKPRLCFGKVTKVEA